MSETQNKKVPVSVIIPAFNDQNGINACLAGIAAQTYPPELIEVIVVDNGSTPQLAITDNYPFSIHITRCATPGSYAARNKGVKNANGSVLAFIDADCWPESEWLVHGVSALMSEAGKSVIGGIVPVVLQEKPTVVALYQHVIGVPQEDNIRDKHFSGVGNLFCTHAQFETIGSFDERLLSGGDREWCWRAVQRGLSVRYAPSAIVYTHPRTSLRSAIRQARRVVAGRKMTRQLDLAYMGKSALGKQRSGWQAAKWILSNKKLSVWNRLRVLCVAVIIRIAAVLESVRLATGANAERR